MSSATKNPLKKRSAKAAESSSETKQVKSAKSAKSVKPIKSSEKPKVKKTKAPPVDMNDKKAVVQQYLPYVRSIAGKVKKSVAKEIEYEDLVEYGLIGLLEASERFNPEAGANFMTFAYYRIRGAIYDGLRGMGWMSRSEYAKAKFEERANEYLAEMATAEEKGTLRPTNPFEMAVSDLADAVNGLATVYLTSIDGAENIQLKDELTDTTEEAFGLEEARDMIRSTIHKLGEQERQLLELYYYKDLSLFEVGKRLGLSKSWTSRLHARVIKKMQRMLNGTLGTVPDLDDEDNDDKNIHGKQPSSFAT